MLRGRYRWVICALLFVATTINYIDRQVIGLLKPDLQVQFSWTERDYAAIVFTFQLAYAIGLLLAGRVMDKLGTKKGFTIAIILWSVAAVGHAFADSVPWLHFPTLNLDEKTGVSVVTLGGAAAGFALARFLLGLGEAGNFPASIKTVAEWFPRKERAFATGIFNSGTNIGALITPLIVPFFVDWWGWEGAFVATGLLGFFWLIWWLVSYGPPQGHPKVTAEELALIESDPPETTTPVPWASIVRYRQTWAFALGKFLTDPVWWLYLFWIPDFLNRLYGLNIKQMGMPIVTIYLITDVGSIGGGWLSSFLIKRGWSINAARKTAMLDLRHRRDADRVRATGQQPLGGRAAGVARGGCASGLVGEPVHAGLRHVPAARRRLGRRLRRHGRRHRRHVPDAGRRRDSPAHRQLRRRLHHRRLDVPHRPGGHPSPGAAPRAGAHRLRSQFVCHACRSSRTSPLPASSPSSG